jgi:dethiobiotin synthetase
VSRPARGVFVTGTDTGVGKTEIACGLVRVASRLGWRAVGMKPVAAGARKVQGRWTNDDVRALAQASSVAVPQRLRNPCLLVPAIAPHIAAREAGVRLEIGALVRAYRELGRSAEMVVVEGAGGFCVPLDERVHMGDLAARLRLPVVLVVGMRLGCLSHALLTAEAIERRGLELAGWIANRIDPRMRRYRDNVATLRAWFDAPLLAEVPHVRDRRARRHTIDARLEASGWASRISSGATASRAKR